MWYTLKDFHHHPNDFVNILLHQFTKYFIKFMIYVNKHKYNFNPKSIYGSLISSSLTPPNSLIDSNASPKVKTLKEKKVEVCSFVRNTSGVEGFVGALGWGLGRVTSRSIIHINIHKPNNMLVSA